MESIAVKSLGQAPANGMKTSLLLPFLAVVVMAAVLVASFFMPYASADEDFRERLEKAPEQMYAEAIGMTNKEAVGISLLEFARIYGAAAELGQSRAIGITCVVIITILGVFWLLCLLFALLRKAIPIIVFDVLAFGVFSLLKWDFQDRGALPNNSYGYGIAHYVYYVAAVLLLAGAVWLLVVKIKQKKQRKTAQAA